jgi:hypothetical protein
MPSRTPMPTNGSCRPALPRARLLTPLVGRCRLGSDRLAAPQPPCGRSPRRLPIASSPVVCCPVTRRIGALSPVVSRPNAGRLPAQRRSSPGPTPVISRPVGRPLAALSPSSRGSVSPSSRGSVSPSSRGRWPVLPRLHHRLLVALSRIGSLAYRWPLAESRVGSFAMRPLL